MRRCKLEGKTPSVRMFFTGILGLLKIIPSGNRSQTRPILRNNRSLVPSGGTGRVQPRQGALGAPGGASVELEPPAGSGGDGRSLPETRCTRVDQEPGGSDRLPPTRSERCCRRELPNRQPPAAWSRLTIRRGQPLSAVRQKVSASRALLAVWPTRSGLGMRSGDCSAERI